MLTTLLNNKYLVRELVARDIRSRYVGSVVGVFWSILNPLIQLGLYTVIFSVILKGKIGDDGSTGRFAESLFCALLPWMALQEGVTRSSRTFIENSPLIKKVRFPLEVLPLTVVGSAFFHQFLGTVVFVVILIVNQTINLNLFALAFVLYIFQILMIYGLSLVVSCLNVFFRDIAQILGVLFMFLFWATPMVYAKSQAPQPWRSFLNLNPLTHMVETYRFVFLGTPLPSFIGLAYWLAFCVGAYYLGRFILERTRQEVVDLV